VVRGGSTSSFPTPAEFDILMKKNMEKGDKEVVGEEKGGGKGGVEGDLKRKGESVDGKGKKSKNDNGREGKHNLKISVTILSLSLYIYICIYIYMCMYIYPYSCPLPNV
jgi:hypothetical protein